MSLRHRTSHGWLELGTVMSLRHRCNLKPQRPEKQPELPLPGTTIAPAASLSSSFKNIPPASQVPSHEWCLRTLVILSWLSHVTLARAERAGAIGKSRRGAHRAGAEFEPVCTSLNPFAPVFFKSVQHFCNCPNKVLSEAATKQQRFRFIHRIAQATAGLFSCSAWRRANRIDLQSLTAQRAS